MKRFFYFAATVLLVDGSLPLAQATKSDPTNVASTRPNEDEDQDGLTNQEEAEVETFPYTPYSDTDTLKDGEDAVPLVGEMKVKAAPNSNYAIIDLGSINGVGWPLWPLGVNDSGKVLFDKFDSHHPSGGANRHGYVWEHGSMEDLGIAKMFVGPLQDGTIYSAIQEVSSERLAGGGATIPWRVTSMRFLAERSSPDDAPVFSFLPGDMQGNMQTVLSAYYSKRPNSFSCVLESDFNLLFANDNHRFIYGAHKRASHEQGEGWYVDVGGVISDTGGGTEYYHSGGWWYYSDPLPAEFPPGSIATLGPTINEINEQEVGTGFTPTPEQAYLVFSPGSSVPIPGSQRIGGITSSTLGSGEGPYFLCSFGASDSLTRLYCYGSGSLVSIDLGAAASSRSAMASLAIGAVSGRSIDNHLVIPVGGSIWRNGRLRTLSELCGKPAQWSGFWIGFITPTNGFMVGTATKASDGLAHSVMLVPVEIKSRTYPYGTGAEGIPLSMLSPVNNLLAAWPMDMLKLEIDAGLNLETFTYSAENQIVWNDAGSVLPATNNEPKAILAWDTPGLKSVEVTVFGLKKRIFVECPDVGTLSQTQVAASDPLKAAAAAIYRLSADGWESEMIPSVGDQKANSLKHSFWNALMSSDPTVGGPFALLLSTAHEFDDRYFHEAIAWDSVMDLHNNFIGSLVTFSLLGLPDEDKIKSELLSRLRQGQLWINGESAANWQIIKSTRAKIFPL